MEFWFYFIFQIFRSFKTNHVDLFSWAFNSSRIDVFDDIMRCSAINRASDALGGAEDFLDRS